MRELDHRIGLLEVLVIQAPPAEPDGLIPHFEVQAAVEDKRRCTLKVCWRRFFQHQ